MKIFRINFVIVCIILVLCMSGCADKQQELSVDELISLGERYLLDSNYEQALVQFNKVIEIEPMNVRGYTGAAEAYIGLEQLDEAVAILQKGFEQTQDDEIRNMLDVLVLNDDVESSKGLTSEQNELIQQLANALAGEDFQSAAAIAGSDIYLQLVKKASENGSIIHHGQNTNLIIYPNGFSYCGELANNLRSGFGIWFCGLAEEGNIYYYKGQWMNDLPNGEGGIYNIIDANYIEKKEGSTYALYVEEVGSFIDGYFDGTFSTTWNMDNGEVHYWTPAYDSGIALIMPDAEVNEGRYDIAICECGANLVSSENQMYCVFGFENKDITYNAESFLGHKVQEVIDLFGDDYVTSNDGGSSFFYYEDFKVPMVFFVGKYIDDNKITGQDTIKYIAVVEGEVLPGIKIGDSAEHIAEVLNVEYSEPKYSDYEGCYQNVYDIIINGVESTMFFQFEQPDGGCVGTQIKGNSLY